MIETLPYRARTAASPRMVRRVKPETAGGERTGGPPRPADAAVTSDWRAGLPVLQSEKVTLRETRPGDARGLFELLTTEEVCRFISPPPPTVEGFERFIDWTVEQRAAGRYLCFAVVPPGLETAVGVFQVRRLEQTFTTAEWGFAIGARYWGTGLFLESARLVVDFAFQTVGVHRLEARSAVLNGRGNGALAKMGAVREATLRRSFERNGVYHDEALWSILEADWRRSKAVWGKAVWGNAVETKAV